MPINISPKLLPYVTNYGCRNIYVMTIYSTPVLYPPCTSCYKNSEIRKWRA